MNSQGDQDMNSVHGIDDETDAQVATEVRDMQNELKLRNEAEERDMKCESDVYNAAEEANMQIVSEAQGVAETVRESEKSETVAYGGYELKILNQNRAESRLWSDMIIEMFVVPLTLVCVLAALTYWHFFSVMHLSGDQTYPGYYEPNEADLLFDYDFVDDKDLPCLEEGERYRYPTVYRFEMINIDMEDAKMGLFDGNLPLINFENPLPLDFVPQDMVITSDIIERGNRAAFAANRSGLPLLYRPAQALLEMVDYAYYSEGLSGFLLVSAYRSIVTQRALFENRTRRFMNEAGLSRTEAETMAAARVARPGHSEHHTGLAIDITSRQNPALLESFGQTAHGIWLAENAWRFGYVVRYLENSTEITGIVYEPWHLRYLGRPHSDFIFARGWVLEQYIEFLHEVGGFTFRDEDGQIWQVDYRPYEEGKGILVPANSDFELSGDGIGGFIVTIRIN